MTATVKGSREGGEREGRRGWRGGDGAKKEERKR